MILWKEANEINLIFSSFAINSKKKINLIFIRQLADYLTLDIRI